MRTAQDEDNKLMVEGYALVFDAPTVIWEYDGVQYKEVIERGALDGADMYDVPFKYNHSSNVMVMARTRNKTLQLAIDEKGLFVRADLALTTTGKDLYTLIQRGDIDKMSFAFSVEEDEYDSKTHTRRIKKFRRIYDVAAVDVPAYEQTSISARGFFELEREKELALERASELRKKHLLLKTYL